LLSGSSTINDTDEISDGRAGSAGLSWDRPRREPRLPTHPPRAGLRGVHLNFASVARPRLV